MKKQMIIAVCLSIFLLHGCVGFVDNFKRPTGIWICEELSITLDFDDNGGMNDPVDARGNIIIDGESVSIVCFISSGGATTIGYSNEEGEYLEYIDERGYLFEGYFENKGKDEMILVRRVINDDGQSNTDEEYTFIRETETED